jgi:hypothetical protein
LIDLKTRAVAPFVPDARTFHNIYKLQKQEMDAILLVIGIVYKVCRIVIKSVQQCTYFLFSVNLLLVGVNYGKNYMFWKLVNSFKMMK